MARSTAEARPRSRRPHPDRDAWARTVSLVVIAVVLVLGASTQIAGLIVPVILALVAAIALRPIASRIESLGAGRAVASVACTLLAALALLSAAGLVVFQAGRVVRQSDRYLERFSQLASRAAAPLQDSKLADLMSDAGPASSRAPGDEGGAASASPLSEVDDRASRSDPGGHSDLAFGEPEFWSTRLRENAGAIGRWLVRGVGGVLGVLGQTVVFLFLILYILLTRATWSDRIVRAGNALGMRLREDDLGRMGTNIGRYVGCVLMVAMGYAVAIALVGWALGLPQWPLWGLITGLLVLIPFIGPLTAGVMLVTVAATTSQALWPPLVMLGVYVLLQTLEDYVILPMLYSEAIAIDPLAVLLGVLFFGFLWGPLGFVAALPMMVLIRGFVQVTPGSEPVGALLGVDEGRD